MFLTYSAAVALPGTILVVFVVTVIKQQRTRVKRRMQLLRALQSYTSTVCG
jgi:preprotein translocase subunit YajC